MSQLPPPPAGPPPEPNSPLDLNSTAEPAQRRKPVAILLAGAGVLVLLCCVGVVAAAVNGGDDEEPANSLATVLPSATAAASAEPSPTASSVAPAISAVPTTTTPSPPKTTPPPTATARPAKVYSGQGDKVVKFKPAISEPLLMTTTWKRGDGNITVYALTTDGEEDDLLVNAIDSYTGQTIFNESGSDIAGLKIEGGGAWKIRLTDLSTAKRWNGSGTYSGKSDGVVDVRGAFEPLDSINFVSSKADSNVTMTAYNTDGDADLVVNDIGNFKGEHLVPNDAWLFVINSDGNWTMRKS